MYSNVTSEKGSVTPECHVSVDPLSHPQRDERERRRRAEFEAEQPRAPGAIWTPDKVQARLVEALGLLRRTGGRTRPQAYGSCWPGYLFDRADIQGQGAQCRLEFYRLRNNVRIPPSPADLARMEQALSWPSTYLSGAGFENIAKAVGRGADWALRGVPVGEGCKRIRLTRRTFYRQQEHGLTIIAVGLGRDRVAVT